MALPFIQHLEKSVRTLSFEVRIVVAVDPSPLTQGRGSKHKTLDILKTDGCRPSRGVQTSRN